MELEEMPQKMKEIYLKVSEETKKHPNVPVIELCRKNGWNSSYYYQARARLKLKSPENKPKRRYSRKIKMETLEVPETPSQVIAFVGTSRSVVDSIRELLK